MYLNQVTVTGRLVADPELKSFGKGDDGKELSILEFRIAVDGAGKAEDKKPTAGYFSVKHWNPRPALVRELKKADVVVAVGRLHLDAWKTKDTDEKREKVLIVADKVGILEVLKSDGAPAAGGGGKTTPEDFDPFAE